MHNKNAKTCTTKHKKLHNENAKTCTTKMLKFAQWYWKIKENMLLYM